MLVLNLHVSPIVKIASDPGKVSTQVIEANIWEISPKITVSKDQAGSHSSV